MNLASLCGCSRTMDASNTDIFEEVEPAVGMLNSPSHLIMVESGRAMSGFESMLH